MSTEEHSHFSGTDDIKTTLLVIQQLCYVAKEADTTTTTSTTAQQTLITSYLLTMFGFLIKLKLYIVLPFIIKM